MLGGKFLTSHFGKTIEIVDNVEISRTSSIENEGKIKRGGGESAKGGR